MEFNGAMQIPVCVHYVNFLERNINTVNKIAETVLGTTQETELESKVEKTDYTCKFISLHQNSV